MDTGKFPPSLLEHMLAKLRIDDPRVLLGPLVGGDAAVIDMGDRLLVAKTNPITFATDHIGWYAVQVNANDVACTGGTPKWFLATLLVPPRFSEPAAEQIFDQVLEACQTLEIALVGGHSEVTYGIDRPVVAGCMLGEMDRDRLVRPGGAQEGDSVVLTKGIAIEGTALLGLDAREALLQKGLTVQAIDQASTLLTHPGISVLTEARIAVDTVPVHAMHDPTEGGLATGLRELAKAAGLGLAVEEGSIPVLPECRAICDALELAPLGLLASGSLLITLPSVDVPRALSQKS